LLDWTLPFTFACMEPPLRLLGRQPESHIGRGAQLFHADLDARDLVQVKYEMVRRVRVDGGTVSRSAAEFGFSRPSFYEAATALDAGGLAALVPARPGPRRAHKMSAEVVAFARQQLGADPALRPADLVGVIEEHFGVRVHPRSVERALARDGRPKSGGRR
jgi:transposase